MVPEAYREYKQYGSTNIPTMKSFIDLDEADIWNSKRKLYQTDIISEMDGKLINEVVDKFSDFSATDLVTLTHNQAPWKEAYVPHMNNEITVEAIKRYFNE